MSDQEQVPETLAVFVLDNGAAAKRLLEAVEKIDEVNDNVQIVDAAIVDRTKRRGAVKVHQTRDRGRIEGRRPWHGDRGGRGHDHRGPGGSGRGRRSWRAPPQSPQPLPRHRDRRQVHEAGREGDREGQERTVRAVHGHLGRVDRFGRAGDPGRERPAHHEHAARRDRGRTQGAGRARRRITGWRRGGRRLRDRGRGGARGGPRGGGQPLSRRAPATT